RQQAHRGQQRQVGRRDHVVLSGGVARRRQRDRRTDLLRREVHVPEVLRKDAHIGVEVGQQIDRVLRKVGEPVVLLDVDDGGIGAARRRGVVECLAQAGQGQSSPGNRKALI